jgi:hypothetical protein
MGRLQSWFGRTEEEKNHLSLQNVEIMLRSSSPSSINVLRMLLPCHNVRFKTMISYAGTHLLSCLGTACSVFTLTLMVNTQQVCVTFVFSSALTRSF